MFAQFQREIEGLITEAIELTYFMRGSLQYEQALERNFAERQLFKKFISKRLEIEAKKPFPNY